MVKKAPKKKLFDKINAHIAKIAGFISAFVAIVGAVTGAVGWLNTELKEAISAQVDDFRQEVKASDEAQNQAIMRLELMNLIQNDPENVVEIEILGRKYFQSGGNSWMSHTFSEWAKQYGGDTSIVVGGK